MNEGRSADLRSCRFPLLALILLVYGTGLKGWRFTIEYRQIKWRMYSRRRALHSVLGICVSITAVSILTSVASLKQGQAGDHRFLI